MTAYYNEFDPKAAAWIRELMRAGVIAEGVVDERSITDVRADDLRGFSQCHFFAGIGGWSYALRLAGVPDDEECWTASCPCQPFSDAGKQMGLADPRHLFPPLRRLIARCGPSKVYGEQVASALGREWLARIRLQLATLGYAAWAADLCSACAGEEAEGWIVRGDSAAWERIVNGAPNIRQRLYWMAHAASTRRTRAGVWSRNDSDGSNPNAQRGQCIRESAASGGSSRLADVHGERCAERAECVGEPVGPEQQAPRRDDALRCGDVGGMGNAGSDRSGRDTRAVSRAEGKGECQRLELGSIGDESFDAGAARGLGNADQSRLAQRQSERSDDDTERATTKREGSQSSFWKTFDIVHCTDGKARRVEPGSFPLATGIPGRVGLLRGYGNAINAELAAQFIIEARRQVAG